MHKLNQEILINYSIQNIYDLIVDIERYPEFLPWCSHARINEESSSEIIADLIIHFKAFTEHYTSRVELYPPDDSGAAEIKVTMISGPFKYLHNFWQLEKIENNVTKVIFMVDFEFKSLLLDKLIGLVFSKASAKMIEAFEKRAHVLYGNVSNEFKKVKKNRKGVKGA